MNHLAKFAAITLLPLALLGMRCDKPVNPPTPPAAGGSVSTGGSPATGGVAPVAGAAGQTGGASTGGAATGGATAVAWPECLPEGVRQAPVKRHPLGRKRSAITRRIKAQYVDLNLPDVFWEPNLAPANGERFFPPLNQKSLGKCTAEGTLGLLLTKPHRWSGTTNRDALELISDDLYRWATRHDPFLTPAPGYWEPIDTGSNGESALNAAVALGYLPAGTFAEMGSFEELQSALQKGPCVVGVDWYDGFFAPDRCGAVKKSGAIAGGHEFLIAGHRRDTKQTLARNSWDRSYGLDGYFWLTDGTLSALLAAGGDAHCLTRPISRSE